MAYPIIPMQWGALNNPTRPYIKQTLQNKDFEYGIIVSIECRLLASVSIVRLTYL